MISNTLKKSILLAISTISVVGSVSIAHSGDGFGIGPADDNGGWVRPCDNPYDPNCSDQGPGYGRSEVKQVYIGRSVRNERLRLRQLAGIGSEYSNYRVVAVRANTRPNSNSQTVARLVVGGRIIATEVNPGYHIDLVPSERLLLGSSNRELTLTIDGSTIIDDIQIELVSDGSGGGDYHPPHHDDPMPPQFPAPQDPNYQPPHQPNPPQYPGDGHQPGYPGHGSEIIDLGIYRSLYGNDRLDLTQYIDMYRYSGRRIQSIRVTASAQYNVALADLLMNSFNVGTLQFSGGYSQTQEIRLNNPDIGGAASSLVLSTRGNMTIERVSIVLSGY